MACAATHKDDQNKPQAGHGDLHDFLLLQVQARQNGAHDGEHDGPKVVRRRAGTVHLQAHAGQSHARHMLLASVGERTSQVRPPSMKATGTWLEKDDAKTTM